MHVSGRQDFPLNLLLLVLHILFINLRGRKLTATNIFGKVNDGQKKVEVEQREDSFRQKCSRCRRRHALRREINNGVPRDRMEMDGEERSNLAIVKIRSYENEFPSFF